MANFGYDDLTVEIDDAVSGSLQDISNEVWTINGMDVQAVLQESHGAGDSWMEKLFTGLKQAADITITGPYDDGAGTATGYLQGGEGEVRTFQLTWDGTATSTVEVLIQSFKRLPARGTVTGYEAILVPTGAVVEA